MCDLHAPLCGDISHIGRYEWVFRLSDAMLPSNRGCIRLAGGASCQVLIRSLVRNPTSAWLSVAYPRIPFLNIHDRGLTVATAVTF